MGARLAALPAIQASTATAFVLFAAVDDDGEPILGAEGGIGATALVGPDAGREMSRPLLIDGRLPSPDRADEVAVDEDFADYWGVDVGDRFEAVGYGPDQLEDIGNARRVAPSGLPLSAHVTGVIRLPGDLAIDTFTQTGSLFEVNRRSLVVSPAYWAEHRDELATYGLEIGLRVSEGVPRQRVGAAARRISDDLFVDRIPAEPAVAAAQRSIDLQAHALLASGALLAIVAAVMLGQGITRTLTRHRDDDRLLVALGLTSREMSVLAVLRVAPIAIGGALGAVALAIALSPLTPFGTARRAEIDPGIDVNLAVLGIGAAVIAVFVVGVAVLSTRRAARASHRRPRAARTAVAAWTTRAGAPPPIVVGTTIATGNRRSGPGLTARVAIVATVIGVAAVTAAGTFGASLQRLVDTPALWGQTWDVEVGNYNEAASSDAGRAALRANDKVGAFSAVSSSFATVDGLAVGAIAIDPLRGDVRPALLEGRLADGRGEVNVGRRTLDALGKDVGDEVEVGGQRATFRARIVGVVVVPATVSADTRLGEGVTMSHRALRRLPGNVDFARAYIVSFASGVSLDAGIASLRRDFEATVVRPITTTDIESLDRVRALPWTVAFLVGVLALTTLAHALVVTVRRQRRDLAVLKTLGFDRGQVRRTIAAEATTFALLALVVGIPIGLVAGRFGWRLAVDAIGIDVASTFPLALLALVPAAILVANAIAAVPAAAAARIRPAVALRSE